MLQKDSDIDENIRQRISASWLKWCHASGFLCANKVPQKFKGKLHRTVICPTMLYGVQQLSVADMRMLHWFYVHTRREDIRDSVEVALIEKKLIQYQLRWFGHVQRMPIEMSVEGF